MAVVLKKPSIFNFKTVTCEHCDASIRYEKGELSWESDHPPYYGLKCPHCSKRIFLDGSAI